MSEGSVAMIDGVLLPPEGALVSVRDRGFLYGDGVFETMRSYGAGVHALEEHVARLARSARAIALPFPVPEETLASEVRAARAASPLREAAVRLVLSRGAGAPGAIAGRGQRGTRVVLIDPLPEVDADLAGGARTVTRAWTPPVMAGAKVSSYLPHLLAAADARARGAHEALLVDEGGRIREGATSNVLVVHEGILVTAPGSDGILEGITRAWVLAIASELGIAIRLASPLLDEALAGEVFLTSTFREVLPVRSIDGRELGAVDGAVTSALRRAFAERVRR